MSDALPGCVPVNVRMIGLTYTEDVTAAPELARSGTLKYSYPCTVICSMYSPSALVSRSNTVSVASALGGSISVELL